MNNSENKGIFSKRNIIIASIVLIILAISIGILIFYNLSKDVWYNNTTIMGEDVSGMTLAESEQKLITKCNAYKLGVAGRDGLSMSIEKDDIDYEADIKESLTQLFNSQHSHFPTVFSKNEYDLHYNISYDEDKLIDLIEESDLVNGTKNIKLQKPIPARMAFDKDKECFVYNEEVPGNIIIKDALCEVVKSSMENGDAALNIDDEKYDEVYKEPAEGAEEDDVEIKARALNNVVVRFIKLKITKGVKEVITPKLIKKWVEYKNGDVKIKDIKISKWVSKICKKYNTVGKTRKVKIHTGKKIKVAGGDYGWQIDSINLPKTIKKYLKKKLPAENIESYIEDKSGKKGITIKEKMPMLTTAFKWSEGDKVEDWNPKNYTEISIADQMVYVFRKGKVKFKCRCITGLPVGDRATKTGTYYVKEHLLEHTMVGADYRTFTKYFVRITWSGTAFHPATWQPWYRWSKTFYRSRGSHGCINLPPNDAVTIYYLVKSGEAVFIH